MVGVPARAALGVLLLLCSGWSQAQAEAWRGRPVEAYIASLAGQGLNVLYSSDLVPADLAVVEEPPEGPAAEALQSVLAAHGLALEETVGGHYRVVRDDCPDGRLAIRVIDRLTLQRLENARVRIGDHDAGHTDADGLLVADCLLPVETRISVVVDDYREATALVRPDADAGITFELDLDVEPLTEIVVSSSVYSLNYDRPGSHTFLDRELSTLLPDLGDEPLRAIQRLPGATSSGITSRTHVRGGNDSEQLILLDGLRLYEPFHLKDFLSFSSIIDQQAIAGMDVYSAGYPVRFGDRMSGVIDISLREPPAGAQTELGLSVFNTSLLSTGSFDGRLQGDWLLSARRGNLDLVSRALQSEYGTPLYEDFLVHLGLDVSDRVYLSANALFSYDKIELSDGDDGVEQARAQYSNIVGWLRADVTWRDDLSSYSILSISDIANERRGRIDNPGIVSGFVDDDRDFQVVGFKQELTWDALPDLSVRAGMDIKRMQASYVYTGERSIEAPFDGLLDNTAFRRIDIETSPDGNQYATWLESRWRPLEWLVIDAGLRWDKQSYTAAESDEQISPRMNVRVDLGDRTSLRFSAGRFYQAQEINELQIIDGLERYYPAARATHLVAGLERQLRSGVDLKLELYRKEYHALPPHFENILDPVVLLPDLQVDRALVDARRALAEGVELTLTSATDGSDFTWWASYAWSQSRDLLTGGYVPRSWDQTHSLKGGLTLSFRDWNFSAAASVHTGWPRTQILVTEQPAEGGGTTFDVDLGPRNNSRYAVFSSLDLRASRTFDVSLGDLEAFIEITNVMNRDNPCCTEFARVVDAEGNDTLVLKDRGWLPIVPSIGVLWTF